MTVQTEPQRWGQRVAALPTRPGVYLFRDAAGDVVYVGKAASLRQRVRSYFGSPHSLEGKTRQLRQRIADLEYLVTTSEQEALILEATLVKRYQPFFNVRLKDDKHYPYLKIDVPEPWPRVYITRRVEKDGARYFGPYASASSVRTTLDLVNKLFPWRSCTKTITGTDPRPCLDYYIHRCIAPCTGYCTKEEYDGVIQQVILFLEGRTDEVLSNLKSKMAAASAELRYEEAARCRDQIRAIERVTEHQVMATTIPGDADIFGLARDESDACVHVFFLRGTKVVGSDHFMLEGTRGAPDAEVLGSFLKQFYESAGHVPRLVLLPLPAEEQELIAGWLSQRRGGRVVLHTPRRGERRRLVERAQENAREALAQERVRWLSDATKTRAALEELQRELGLPTPPQRIECYDISNIQGTNSVGSMAVFVDGHPRPPEYRRFRIKTVVGADDFASMAEVLRRRFRRLGQRQHQAAGAGDEDESFGTVPDLVIVDGGRGQLNAAADVMLDLGLQQVPLAGLAKKEEELFVKDMADPIVLPRTSQALYLVQRVRDEAHRFAITYHRKTRAKVGMRSALDAVPGIGPVRKRALLRKFGSVQRIREAELDDLAATVGFTRVLAERVKEHL